MAEGIVLLTVLLFVMAIGAAAAEVLTDDPADRVLQLLGMDR